MKDKYQGILYGAFIADAYALAPHWIYDTKVLLSHFSDYDEYENPTLTNYHTGKVAGDFTHYGDQMAHLHRFLKKHGEFDIELYKKSWLDFVQNHTMYMDHATKESIECLVEEGQYKGSKSDDLGGIVVNAAFYEFASPDFEDMVMQMRLTHNNDELLMILSFYYKVIGEVLKGEKPSEAIVDVKDGMNNDFINGQYEEVMNRFDDDTTASIVEMGQSCSARYGLPSSLYLIIKYEEDFQAAMKANILAGGDSAARGMMVGMVLGAYHGLEKLPQKWVEGLNYKF